MKKLRTFEVTVQITTEEIRTYDALSHSDAMEMAQSDLDGSEGQLGDAIAVKLKRKKVVK